MKVFVTGPTGFVGSVVVAELIRCGHQVLGLARSDSSAKALTAMGAKVHRGELEDLESLKSGAAAADGIIHCGFIHDFSRFKEVCEVEKQALEAMGSVLIGSDRPFVITSGTLLANPGHLATEEDRTPMTADDFPRVLTEQGADSLAERDVNTSLVRLSPSVHGTGDHGFVPMLINLAREKGEAAYIGEGNNRWSAVHRLDAAVLFRLALERAEKGARYHGAADEGIPFRDIATAIGKGLGVPVVSKSKEEAAGYFTWMVHFAGIDGPASSKLTRERLGWNPVQPGLLDDMQNGGYFQS
ncbi:MAG TPA: SDR family oxidoreductase [Fimbriimonadaceae bacterium]|jgi:nucleoside-diphosphate-sugar epimerase